MSGNLPRYVGPTGPIPIEVLTRNCLNLAYDDQTTNSERLPPRPRDRSALEKTYARWCCGSILGIIAWTVGVFLSITVPIVVVALRNLVSLTKRKASRMPQLGGTGQHILWTWRGADIKMASQNNRHLASVAMNVTMTVTASASSSSSTIFLPIAIAGTNTTTLRSTLSPTTSSSSESAPVIIAITFSPTPSTSSSQIPTTVTVTQSPLILAVPIYITTYSQLAVPIVTTVIPTTVTKTTFLISATLDISNSLVDLYPSAVSPEAISTSVVLLTSIPTSTEIASITPQQTFTATVTKTRTYQAPTFSNRILHTVTVVSAIPLSPPSPAFKLSPSTRPPEQQSRASTTVKPIPTTTPKNSILTTCTDRSCSEPLFLVCPNCHDKRIATTSGHILSTILEICAIVPSANQATSHVVSQHIYPPVSQNSQPHPSWQAPNPGIDTSALTLPNGTISDSESEVLNRDSAGKPLDVTPSSLEPAAIDFPRRKYDTRADTGVRRMRDESRTAVQLHLARLDLEGNSYLARSRARKRQILIANSSSTPVGTPSPTSLTSRGRTTKVTPRLRASGTSIIRARFATPIAAPRAIADRGRTIAVLMALALLLTAGASVVL